MGDFISVVDDSGKAWRCRIVDPEGVTAELVEEDRGLRPLLPLTAYVAVIKGERMDYAIEKVAEAGAGVIVPLLADRCVIKDVSASKIDRWRRIAKAAAMQSGSAAITEIGPPQTVRASDEPFWYFDAAGTETPRSTPKAIFIGPEGGWSEGELGILAPGERISLGEGIFRTETAAVVGTFLAGLKLKSE